MKRALLALLLAASVVAVAQDPKAGKPAEPKTAAEKKADKKAEKKAAKEAKKAEAQAAAKPAASPAPATKPTPGPAAKAAASSTAIVANKDSKTYHRADCKVAARMKEANKASFASGAEADKAGYKACKVCKP